MTDRVAFEYALLRVLPDIERGESINVGVLLWCQSFAYLGAFTDVDRERLRGLSAQVDLDAVSAAVAAVRTAAEGDSDSGPTAGMTKGERFRWLTSPRSTVVQPGPVHAGLTADPAGELERLAARLVKAR